MVFPLLPMLGKLIMGEVVKSVVEGKKKPIETVTKGLIRSKTAIAATGGLSAKLMVIIALPLDTRLIWLLCGAVLLEWCKDIYLRVKTNTPV